ncbi:PucR-like helix-turn-helix protein [Nocardia tenerifensis]|uniref:PucR-like helix-turn-helix protein n=1 Tax=Nocardia tenerifensis TaxID=228006 RepID=A0A318JZU4_9NOCA|nr:helix-turn-helix domain-containing protein [Nocardia tenerifensis]PXX60872.1 PucR-like helix-turn-helix protein [Nocardia tenerifensis]
MDRLYDQLAPRLTELARTVVRRCAVEVPFYRDLPAETLAGPVTESVTAALGLLLRLLRDKDTIRPDELTWLVELSGRRARDHLPLEAALAAYLVGATVWWQTITELTEPDELPAAGAFLLESLTIEMPGVVVAHLQVQEDLRSHDHRLRNELLTALLHGHPHLAIAQAAQMEVAARHTVLMYRLAAPRPDRLVQSALDAHAGTHVLTDHTEGLALLPARVEPDALISHLRQALSTTVLAAAATAATAELPAAAGEAREVMALLIRLGRTEGLYWFDDVLVEYQLARPGAGLERLAAKLEPLASHPHLMDTLRVFVDTGYNRRQTALELFVHRNTVEYRLHRIALLTGLNLTDPAHTRILQAALTATDLLKSPPPQPH